MTGRLASLALFIVAVGCSSEPEVKVQRQLCVVRHAEAFKNLPSPPVGMSEQDLDALTVEGREEATELGKYLPKPVGLLWSSPARRAAQTAGAFSTPVSVQIDTDLRPLDGPTSWAQRKEAWKKGVDPTPPNGESLAMGRERALKLLAKADKELASGHNAVVVTHGDMTAILLGEAHGTPLLERPEKDIIPLGGMSCVPFPELP